MIEDESPKATDGNVSVSSAHALNAEASAPVKKSRAKSTNSSRSAASKGKKNTGSASGTKSSSDTAVHDDGSVTDRKEPAASAARIKKSPATKAAKSSASVAKSSKKKGSDPDSDAQRSTPSSSAAAPSIEEVSAFISSLKSAKSQGRKKETHVQESKASYENADDRRGAAHDEVVSDHGQSVPPASAGDAQQAPISRREKRRLEWLEKRRQWRDQKKNERLQRRHEPGDGPQEALDDSMEGPPQDATSDAPVSSPLAPSRSNTASKRDAAPRLGVQNAEAQQTTQEHGKGQQRLTSDGDERHDKRGGNRRGKGGRKDEQHLETQQGKQRDDERHGEEASDTRKSGARRPQQKQSDTNTSQAKGDTGTARQQQDSEHHGKTAQQGRDKHKDRDSRGGAKTDRQTRHVSPDEIPPPLVADARVLPPAKHYFVYKDIHQKPELHDDVARLVERVETYMHDELCVEDGESILIGVSGGVDSVVLLDILHILSFEHAFTLNVAHVNHGLRGAASKNDEKFVRQLAQKYDVQCHATQVKVDEFAKKHSLSEETAARELRYKFFRQTASTLRAQFCATAHNADDAAETMLMNLFRGTGLTGLGSIPPRRALVKKTQLIRPLLTLSKQEILEYAQLRELEWHEDETNTLTKYTRNKVRHDLLPKIKEEYNPNIVETLNRTATLLRRADGFIDSLIHATYQSVIVEKDDSSVIDVHKLDVLHPFLQGEIIERAVSSLTFGRTVSFAAIDRILGLLKKDVGTREDVVNNLIALRNHDEIVLMYEQHLQEVFLTIYKLGEYSIGKISMTLEECHRNDVRIGQDRNVEYFDYDRLPYRLTLRTWHPGDAFHPIGFNGHMKVSDVLTNEKVDHNDRASKVVLATATDIVWLCGIRMSDDFKITNDTRRIVRATFSVR